MWASTNQQVVATHWISFELIEKFVEKKKKKKGTEVLVSQIPVTVTLNEGEGHLDWYEHVEFNSPYYDAKYDKNWSINVRI